MSGTWLQTNLLFIRTFHALAFPNLEFQRGRLIHRQTYFTGTANTSHTPYHKGKYQEYLSYLRLFLSPNAMCHARVYMTIYIVEVFFKNNTYEETHF